MITLDPPASRWRSLLDDGPSWRNGALTDIARHAREQAGLPTDRPIVMTGHQPTFWHPGILAKFLACRHACEGLGAHSAWIVPDQDEVDPLHVRVPVFDARDKLIVRQCALGEAPLRGAAVSSLPAAEPDETEAYATLDSVNEGLARIRGALASHSGAPDLARQTQGALADLLVDRVGRVPTVYATDFHSLDVYNAMLDEMERHPERLAHAYNSAVRANPDAGVNGLVANEVNDRWELPLWHVSDGEPRRRVYAEQLDDLPSESIVPRALSMTAIARAHLCDLFIHGTGGGLYDRLTEQWMEKWSGTRLAHAAIVSATLTLPLRDEQPTQERVRQARSRAHASRHNPEIVGDTSRGDAKRALIERIESTKHQGGDPAELFHALQELLSEHREANAEAIERLASAAPRPPPPREELPIVEDRTWAFPLHASAQIDALDECLAHQFQSCGASV
ncbi:MAG: hypothetical protein ACF8GE_03190 [Phycisphaerales bacterium JB043]